MSTTIKTHIKYDGNYLSDHTIDLTTLTNSLLGLSSLIQNANEIINRNAKTKVNIQVKAGVEQNCFELCIIFNSNFIEQVNLLFKETSYSIKDILEILGLLSGEGLFPSVLDLIKIFKGKKLSKDIIIEENKDNVIVQGDNNTININKNVYNTYQDPKFRKQGQKFFSPLENEGIENIEITDKKTNNSKIIEAKDCNDYLKYNIDKEEKEEYEPNISVRHLEINKPELVYDSKNWTFILAGKRINVDISNTNIAKETIDRGEIRIGDTYQVELEETEYKTAAGKFNIKYKITKVLKFIRGNRQTDIEKDS